MDWKALGILFSSGGAVVGPFLTYAALRRTKSGRIESSEAKDLWTESTKMRAELQEQIDKMQVRLDGCYATIAQLRTDLEEAREELYHTRKERDALRTEVRELKQLLQSHGITLPKGREGKEQH